MEGVYEIMSELAIGGNIYPSSREYQAVPLSPFFALAAQVLCIKLQDGVHQNP